LGALANPWAVEKYIQSRKKGIDHGNVVTDSNIAIYLNIFFRFLLGEKIFEHVAAKLIYDVIKGIFKIPFLLFSFILKTMKIR